MSAHQQRSLEVARVQKEKADQRRDICAGATAASAFARANAEPASTPTPEAESPAPLQKRLRNTNTMLPPPTVLDVVHGLEMPGLPVGPPPVGPPPAALLAEQGAKRQSVTPSSAPSKTGTDFTCICWKTPNPCGWRNGPSVKIPSGSTSQQRMAMVQSLVPDYTQQSKVELCTDRCIQSQRISRHHFSPTQLQVGKGGNPSLKADALADVPVSNMRKVPAPDDPCLPSPSLLFSPPAAESHNADGISRAREWRWIEPLCSVK